MVSLYKENIEHGIAYSIPVHNEVIKRRKMLIALKWSYNKKYKI